MKAYTGRLISILYRKSQIFWANYLKPYNISSAEYPILIVLNRHDGITQDEISSELYVDKSGITRSVKLLEEKGFVERRKDESDLRCNRIFLTEKGKESFVIIKRGMDKWDKIMTKGIKDDDVEEACITLSHMVENIENTENK